MYGVENIHYASLFSRKHWTHIVPPNEWEEAGQVLAALRGPDGEPLHVKLSPSCWTFPRPPGEPAGALRVYRTSLQGTWWINTAFGYHLPTLMALCLVEHCWGQHFRLESDRPVHVLQAWQLLAAQHPVAMPAMLTRALMHEALGEAPAELALALKGS